MQEIIVRGSESRGVERAYKNVLDALALAGIEVDVRLEKEKAGGIGTAGKPRIYVDGIKASLEDFEMKMRLAKMFESLA